MFYFSYFRLQRERIEDEISFEKPSTDCYELKTDNNVIFYIKDKFYNERFSKFSEKEKNNFAKEIEILYLSYLKDKCSEQLKKKDNLEYKIKNSIGDKTLYVKELQKLEYYQCDKYKEMSRILKR